jgi:GT2 family glycosyltransferase
MNPETSRVLCVLGMHRTGSSMIMRVLHAAGLHLGPEDDLLGPHESNPLGHFENKRFIAVNDALLTHFGGSWHDPPELPQGWEDSPGLEVIREDARATIRSVAEQSPWGWKDPRTTILVPFWKSLVENLSYVICLRSPLEVARSLEKRNGISLATGVALWSRYTRDAIRTTGDAPRLFVIYEDFLRNPREEVSRLLDFADLPASVSPEFVEANVAVALKHHDEETTALLANRDLELDAKLLHVSLRALVAEERLRRDGSGRTPPAGDAVTTAAAYTSAGADRLLELIEELRAEDAKQPLHDEIRRQERALAAVEEALAAERRVREQREQHIEELERRETGLSAHVDELERRLHTSEATIRNLEAVLQESLAMRFVRAFWGIKDRLFPKKSRRRDSYDLLLKSVKKTLRDGIRPASRRSLERLKESLARRSPPVLRTRSGAAFPPPAPLPAPERLPRVDIVIVTHNSADCLAPCLKGIARSDYPHEKTRLIVVDNASRDDSLRVLANATPLLPPLTTVRSRRNVGFGRGVNRAAREATGEYLLLLNPDARLRESTLSTLVRYALAGRKDGFGCWEARQEPYEHPKLYDPVTLESEWSSGACMLISRIAFREVAGFDPNLFLYAEDVDLSWRLRAAGHRIQYVPAATVLHETYGEAGGVKPTQFYHSIASNGILRHKYGSASDLALFFILWTECFLSPPELPRVRWHLLSTLVRTAPRFARALFWRLRKRIPHKRLAVRFDQWDYGVRRSGDFHRLRPAGRSPRASIVIRTKDRPNFLRDALQSLRHQTYRNFEVVVIEDGPAQAESVIREFPELDIRYEATGEPVGRCAAGNLGLRRASGEYCNFLDDDDLLFADHLEVLVNELERQAECRAGYSVGLEVKTRLLSLEPLQYEEAEHRIVHRMGFDREALSRFNYIPINCMMFRRELFEEAGGFDPSLDLLEDWELWVRYARLTDFLFVDKTTCLYRVPLCPDTSSARQEHLDSAYERVRHLIEPGSDVEALPSPVGERMG